MNPYERQLKINATPSPIRWLERIATSEEIAGIRTVLEDGSLQRRVKDEIFFRL